MSDPEISVRGRTAALDSDGLAPQDGQNYEPSAISFPQFLQNMHYLLGTH